MAVRRRSLRAIASVSGVTCSTSNAWSSRRTRRRKGKRSRRRRPSGAPVSDSALALKGAVLSWSDANGEAIPVDAIRTVLVPSPHGADEHALDAGVGGRERG